MRNFFFILKSLCGGKSANTPPTEFSYASQSLSLAFLKPLALTLLFVLGSVNVWGEDVTGTISFGSATGSTNVNSASVTGDDSQSNSWTVTTVGTTSFTPNASYAQIGSGKKPATSITFTTTLSSAQTITAFSAKFGGFGDTEGTVTLKVGETTVGTGSLNATNDVIVSATNTITSGTVLTVTVTGISKGVKAYYISYSYPKPEEKCNVTLNRNGATETINNVVVGTALDDIDGTGAQGGCSEWTFVGWSKTQRAAQNNSTAMTLVTEVDGPGPYYAVYSHTESGGGNSTASSNNISSISASAVTLETGKPITYKCSASNEYSNPARIYKGKTITIAGATITSISLTGVSDYAISNMTVNTGTLSTSGDNGTWEGSATSIVFTASSAQTRISAIAVTYTGGSTTYYSTTASCCEALGQISGSVNLSDEEQRSITVNWTKPTTESDVDHYELSYKVQDSSDEPTVINNIAYTDGSYIVSGLACSTTYEFILKAVGDASHCDYTSDVVEGTTLPALTLPTLSYTTGLTAGGANINPIWATPPTHGGTVTYVSSNPSVLEVINASTGEVKPVGAGEATITATYAETASNCEASQTSNMVSVSGNVSVSFNANGGSGEMSNQSIQYNTATALTANGFTAPSCRYFYGWATSQENANNEVRAYTNGQEVTITEGMNLYAIWKVYNYNVVKSTGTGTASFDLSATSVDCGGSITVTATPDATHKGEPTITITPSNAGTVNGNTIENITADITAVDVSYAAKENYSVTWSVNGETVSKDFIEGTTFAAIMEDASKPVVADNAIETNCEANKFMGWATAVVTKDNAESGDVAWFDGSAILSGAQTFYAVWAKEAIVPSNTYAAIKSTSGLEEDNYVIAYSYNNGEQIVLKNTEHASSADGKLAGYSLALSGDKYSNPSNAYVWTLQAQNDGSYYIYNAAIEKYVNATTTAATLSDTPTKFTLEYNSSESRWIIKLASSTDYAFHGYVTSKNNSVTDRDFRVSSDAISHTNASRYRIYLYKNEKETIYSEFRTNCCALKAATGIELGAVTANSVTLNWTAPSSTDGITKLQVVDGNDVVKVDGLAANATTATISGLTECAEYTFRVVSVGAECNALSEAVTAMPYGSAKVVTFVYNDGATANIVEATTCTVNTVNVPSTPSRDGYRFMGWFNGESEVTGETFTPAETTTIEARWAQLFTVHYNFAGATFGEAPEDVQYIAGEEVILTDVVPNKGVLAPFKAWSFSTDVEVAAGKFNMPASDLTITATYNEIVGQWILVTDESTLSAGDYVIIAAAGYDYAMSTTQNETKYRHRTSITKSGNTISTPSNDVQIFVLEEGTVADSWAFKCLNGDYKDKYIYANSNSDNNYMNSQATNDANGSWKLNLVGGYATAQGTNKKKVLRYNNDRFACYETASQSAIAFYQFREGVFYDVTLPEEVTGGSVSANTSMAKAGETVTLTYAPSRGYTVETLTVTGATSGEITISPAIEAGVTEYTFTMPAEAVTVAASFEAIPPVVYNLVENADDLAVGMQFLMVGAKSAGYEASGAWNSGGFLAAVNINAPSEKKISITTEEVEEITLEGESGAWLLVSDAGLLRESSKNLYTAGEPSKWTITITGGTATVHDGTYPLLYNANSSRFKTYDGTNDQIHAIALYALPYTTYNFTLSDCKTIKVADGYTYTYTIKNTDVPSETPANCEFYAWTDGANYYRAGDPITVNAEITLTAVWKEILRGELYEGKWGTFCPQHEIRAFEGASFYTLTYLQMEAGMPYKLFFDEVETDYLEAGKPYLFIAEGEAIKGIKVGNEVTTAANYNGFYGNVSGSTNTISTSQTEYQASGDIVNYYGLKNNTFTLLGNGTAVANERAVVQIKNGQLDCPNPPLHLAPARPGVRRVVASNNAPQIATGVDELNASETPVKMMIDGQLFILRGEKMYDATGRLVR